MTGFTYPLAHTVDQVDVYHGVPVKDPYRWLEDAHSLETRAWIDAENAITFAYLENLPGREAIKKRLTKLWEYENYSAPFKEGGRYFFFKNDGLQNQSVLYVADALDAAPRVLLDPNKLSKDGTVALSGVAVSEDGKHFAYGLSDAGSDWVTWHVRDVETGVDTSDRLRWVKFSGAVWSKDGKGFYYGRYAEPAPGEEFQQANYYQKLYYHRLGDPQEKDALVYERSDQKGWRFGASVTEDGKYLLLYVRESTANRNRLFYRELSTPDAPVVEWLDKEDAAYHVIGNDGPIFYVQTNRDAPREKVVAMDLRDSDPAKWRTILPESEDTLQGVSLFGNLLIANYLQNAHTVIKVYDLDGRFVRGIDLPGIGSAGGFGGKRIDAETFYSFTSFTTPTTIYRYDIPTGRSEAYRKAKVDFDPDDYVTRQVFYTSKDGTRVPMFVTHHKNITPDGNNATLLYGYGGFNGSMTPGFAVSRLLWMEMGGVYAVACLRGGGEYGEAWHEAGTKLKKQNVFDDFIAAAEWLIGNGYTLPKRLAIQGGSNGGLLVGACMTQRPDLFGVALPAVGVMDMLRYPKFTIGWAWVSDYGDPDNNEDEFRALFAYSPYHNLKRGTRYPATLITTSDHDDRVVPAHSFKFAAALQAAQAPDGPPILIRIETRAGHGAGKPTAKVIEEQADVYTFTAANLGMGIPSSFRTK
jgi:prolyl oligopeptidase